MGCRCNGFRQIRSRGSSGERAAAPWEQARVHRSLAFKISAWQRFGCHWSHDLFVKILGRDDQQSKLQIPSSVRAFASEPQNICSLHAQEIEEDGERNSKIQLPTSS